MWPGALTGSSQGGCAMRKPLLSLAAIAIVATACSSSGMSHAPSNGSNPEHHRDDRATPLDRQRRHIRRCHVRGSRCQPVRRPGRGPGVDVRARRRHRLVHHRPALHRGRQPARSCQRSRRGVGQRVRAGLRAARGRRVRDLGRRRADARSPTPTRSCSGSGSRRARSATGARQDASLTFVVDTSGSMAREDRLELVKDALRHPRRRARPRRPRRDRDVRRRRPGRPRVDLGARP